MARFCLDTNTCIDAMKGLAPGLPGRLAAVSPKDVAIPSLVRGELLVGVMNSCRIEKVRASVMKFLAPYSVLSFDRRAAEHYADIRVTLEKRGWPIGPNDLIIAATAKAFGCTLITHNVREFSRVPGLLVEDWYH